MSFTTSFTSVVSASVFTASLISFLSVSLQEIAITLISAIAIDNLIVFIFRLILLLSQGTTIKGKNESKLIGLN